MTMPLRSAFSGFLLASSLVAAVSCGDAEQRLPATICGTRVSGEAVRGIVGPARHLHEFNRVSRAEATSAPCSIISGRKAVLSMNFYWTSDEPDVSRMQSRSLLDVTEPRRIESKYKTYIGNDGALSTTVCGPRSAKHFTLLVRLPQINPVDHGRRRDIEKFMRAYFPAAVGTLGCS
ncbi:hypothetical protein JK359_05920 [Streptomyces actinomycinicus]|uniref:DUF3558 domain-containing protein n=1 Tax=Streptomyces actinomycinicus TaxID=1695166 RepID=A0A937JLP3_9ACTN|nr:hypothetical protein [Streptomyces actinomycinicus]MBL1081521.1 hypothetical protein [Streptomyces actinomycinicus]